MSENRSLTAQVVGSWRFWLSLVISVLFLALAVRQVDWDTTAATLTAADPWLLILGIGLFAAVFVLFALRWRVLLSPVVSLPARAAFSYIMIGYLANTVLPLRLGDVARATLLGHRYRIGATPVLGPVVLERILDLLTLLLLALALSVVVDISPVVRGGMMTVTLVALVALLTLLALVVVEDRLPSLAERLPRRLPRAPIDRFLALTTRFAVGARILRSRSQLMQTLALSALAWGAAGVATMCYVAAFDLPVPWYAGFFVLTVINLGSAIPSSPGFIGVYHYLVVLALSTSIYYPHVGSVL